jgi:acetyl esterase/lipase
MREIPAGSGQLERCFQEDFDSPGSVIICPGGSYRFLSPREAEPVARRFLESGWRPYILRYSTGENLGTTPLLEAARALRLVREQDAASGRKGPVVLCGFSAGGHLAASLGVHWNNAALFPDASSRLLQRPDALALCYPVINVGVFTRQEIMDGFTRIFLPAAGATDGLGGATVGSDATAGSGATVGSVDLFTLESHVGADTPPSFIWHTACDELVPAQNSLLFADALLRAGVPLELHIFPRGRHGLSLATPEVDEPEAGRLSDVHVARWFDLCIEWMNGIVEVYEYDQV